MAVPNVFGKPARRSGLLRYARSDVQFRYYNCVQKVMAKNATSNPQEQAATGLRHIRYPKAGQDAREVAHV